MNTDKVLIFVLAVCLVVALAFKQKDDKMEQEVKNTKSLFDETTIGKIKLKNRFVRASVGDDTPTGEVLDKTVERYEQLAKGGVGTILTGYTLIDASEQNMGILSMYDDRFISGAKRLADVAHQYGSNILMQLVYVGSEFHRDPSLAHNILGASAVRNLHTGLTPKEMSHEDIKRVIGEFADAAVRAKKAGFDGIEIHACHGYLLHQFASPYYNRRTDEYGGNRENRYRLTLEVYKAIRQAAGKDFQVWIKVQSQDSELKDADGNILSKGVTNADCLYLCRELAKLGIDAIEVSGNFQDFRGNKAFFRDIADNIAAETSLPTIVTGGNRDYKEMERMINDTHISYVGMARPLLARPDLINKFADEYHAKE